MKMDALLYTIVRFAPFSETGEFANIGIVLISPQLNYFDFKIQRKKYARVVNFFKEVDQETYRAAVRNLHEELQRMKRFTNNDMSQLALTFEDMSVSNLLMQELLRKKEGVIRFDKLRMAIAENPKKELERLYAYYVDRSFATPQYIEQVLEKEVRESLKELNISDRYIEARLHDGVYQARLPFVRYHDGKVQHAIKPISLSQERPEAIIEHANKWAYAISRLKEAGKISGKVLFPARAPDTDKDARYSAFREAKELLEKVGGKVVPTTEAAKLKQFV